MEPFTTADIMLIEKEIGRKPYSDIAFLIDRTKADVAEFVKHWLDGKDVVPYELQLQQKRASRAPVERKPRAKKEKQKKPVIISRSVPSEAPVKPNEGNFRMRRGQPVYNTKAVDLSKLVQVRIDAKTCIFIKPGQDPEEEKARFISNLKRANSSTFYKNIVD